MCRFYRCWKIAFVFKLKKRPLKLKVVGLSTSAPAKIDKAFVASLFRAADLRPKRIRQAANLGCNRFDRSRQAVKFALVLEYDLHITFAHFPVSSILRIDGRATG